LSVPQIADKKAQFSHPTRTVPYPKGTASMTAVAAAVPAAENASIFPLALTIALAVVALAGIALYVRRQRLAGRLNGVTTSASVVSAAGVLVSALLVSVTLGSAAAATASTPPSVPSSVQQSVNISVDGTAPVGDDLDGFQLPTE
jgi:hypothetical protein